MNHPSRIHYPENKKPRACTTQYDFLYHTGRGRVEPYDPEKHGLWEIHLSDDGQLTVKKAGGPEPIDSSDGDPSSSFALESHLRDYLARNLSNTELGVRLDLYIDSDGRDGVEYQTDVGPIDILATDSNGDFHVIELKVGRGPDAALGQILRYMGWVKLHLAREKQVFGVVLAADISEKLKYAVTQVPSVRLMEYELQISVKPVGCKTAP